MLQPITQLSPSREVAQFIDDDQFGFGQSVDKCGYEAVALVWHSVRPGARNPYAARDIHAMAASDYAHFAGPDVASNHNGMSVEQLYADLAAHGLRYRACPVLHSWISGWLRYGFPVILAVEEASVYDEQLKGSPYGWNTAGLSHIIVTTGPGDSSSSVRVRDTANVQAPGVVRPGPRQYDIARLQLLSVTVIFPGWLSEPPAGFDPTQQGVLKKVELTHITEEPSVADQNKEFDQAFKAQQVWARGAVGVPFNPEAAIEKSWMQHLQEGRFLGVPLETEQHTDIDGVLFVEQIFSASYARWDSRTNAVLWMDARGNL